MNTATIPALSTSVVFMLLQGTSSLLAQDRATTTEAEHVTQPRDLAPKGWVILDTCIGLLNNDELRDLAVVLQANDSSYIMPPWSDNTDTVFAQRRQLVVLLGKAGGGYDVLTKNDRFIPLHDDPISSDPFAEMRIEYHRLIIYCVSWYSMGSWWAGSWTYVFKLADTDLQLMQAAISLMHRATHEGSDYSFDLATSKFTLVENSELEDEGRMKRSEGTMTLNGPIYLSKMNAQGTWEIIPNVFL